MNGDALESPLVLDADSPRRTGLKHDLPFYARLYGSSVDTIKRWRKISRQKGESIPLDDPAAVASWWTRYMKWSVPDGILSAAKAKTPSASSTTADKTTDSPASSEPSSSPASNISILGLDLDRDEEVQQAASLVKGNYEQLIKALAGKGGEPTIAQRNWERAQEVLRKVRKNAEERALRSKDLIPRADVEHDMAKLADMLRQMDESADRRVLELCPSLSAEARLEVAAAMARLAEARQRALRTLDSITHDFTLSAA